MLTLSVLWPSIYKPIFGSETSFQLCKYTQKKSNVLSILKKHEKNLTMIIPAGCEAGSNILFCSCPYRLSGNQNGSG